MRARKSPNARPERAERSDRPPSRLIPDQRLMWAQVLAGAGALPDQLRIGLQMRHQIVNDGADARGVPARFLVENAESNGRRFIVLENGFERAVARPACRSASFTSERIWRQSGK